MKEDDTNFNAHYWMPRGFFGALPGPCNVRKVKHSFPIRDAAQLTTPHRAFVVGPAIEVAVVPDETVRLGRVEADETLVKARDVPVRRGAKRASSNRSEEICSVAFIVVDGRRD